MNSLLLAAGVLASATTVGHAVGGEYLIFKHVQTAQLPSTLFGDGDITKRFFRVGWHAVTMDFFLSAAMLLLLGSTNWLENSSIIARFIALHFFGYTFIIGLVAGRRLSYTD
jgi:hypothetical protein